MINDFEDWLASLGILWVELEDGPKGAVVVWCPGFWPRSMTPAPCWVIPEDVALKLIVLG